MSDLDKLNMSDLRDVAAEAGVTAGHLRKAALIKAIEEVADVEVFDGGDGMAPQAPAPEPEPEPELKPSTERYTVLVDHNNAAVYDNQFERIHDGWWGDGDKGVQIALDRCAKANQNDVYTGLSDEQRAANQKAGLEQFVVS